METTVCLFCQHPTPPEKLAEVNWLSAGTLTDLAEHHPGWRSADGSRWLDDPANPNKRWDGGAGFKGVLFVPLLRR